MPLVLSRKETQTIIADGPVTIRVVRISGNRVILACEAGRETVILRGEILERKWPSDDENS